MNDRRRGRPGGGRQKEDALAEQRFIVDVFFVQEKERDDVERQSLARKTPATPRSDEIAPAGNCRLDEFYRIFALIIEHDGEHRVQVGRDPLQPGAHEDMIEITCQGHQRSWLVVEVATAKNSAN